MGLDMENDEAEERMREWILEEFYLGPEIEGTDEWRDAKKAFRQHVRELRLQEKNEYDAWIFDALTANARHRRAHNVAMEELDTLLSLISIDSLSHEQQVTI